MPMSVRIESTFSRVVSGTTSEKEVVTVLGQELLSPCDDGVTSKGTSPNGHTGSWETWAMLIGCVVVG